MSPATNTPDNDLTRTLRNEADRFAQRGGSSLDLEQVMDRAGEIRRGRRMRATMVMAAVVLAMAVPVGITVLDDSPVRKPEQLVATEPDGTPIGLGTMATGKAPRNGYVTDGTLHGTDAPAALGAGGDPISLARIEGGFLVGRVDTSTGDTTATFVGDDGTTIDESWPLQGGFAVSPAGNVGAFAEPDGTVVAVQDGGARYFEIGSAPDAKGEAYWQVAAVTGENCSGRSEEAGCTVYLENRGRTAMIGAVAPNQEPSAVLPALRSLAGIAPDGDAAGIISATDTGSCSAVLDTDGAEVWNTCTYSFDGFSPDGRYLLAGPAYRDGFGSGSLAFVNARTGAVALHLKTFPNVAITSAVWEDDTHVLATVSDGRRWAVERIRVDGEREYALAPIQGSQDYSAPYLVARR